MSGLITRVAVLATSAVLLAACSDETSRYPARAYAPIPGETLSLMKSKDTDRNAPVLIRAYKKESEVEVWKQASSGDYVHLKTYPICRWSGQLGPKKKEGDRQVPEGFYTVAATQMNPNSAYWLAFNVGYPNNFERALGRNGGDIMVHGTCSSRGCFAMTNEQIEEIYAIMRESFNGGQKAVQFQSYPFRMTAENMAKFRHDPNMAFWKNLKEGSDNFEVTKKPVQVGFCGSKYVFNANPQGPMDPLAACPTLKTDPEIATAVAEKARADESKVAELVHKGTPAIRIQYADGSQHPSFRSNRALAYASGNRDDSYAVFRETKTASLGEVSRPEAIEAAEEIVVDETGKPKAAPAQVAAAKPAAPASPAVRPGTQVASAPATAARPQVAAAPANEPVAAGSGGGALAAIGSFFSPSAPANTGSIAPAPSQSAAPPAASSKQEKADKPFYKRWLSWGSDDPAPSEAAPAAAAPVPAAVPLPPKRQADAKAPKPERQSAVPMTGARVAQAGVDAPGTN
jgi:murein L,D-transpeptidase YafK